MKLHITASTVKNTVTGQVAWGDGAETNLGVKDINVYVDGLMRATNPKIGLLPPAVRWISKDKRIVVFERPPSYQRVAYYELERAQVGQFSEGDNKLGYIKEAYPLRSYTLPLPWTIYVMGFGFDYQPVSIRVYMKPESIFSLDDTVYLLPLLNFYTNSKLCNPIFEKFEETEVSVAAGIHSAYNTVWNSGFNFDLVDATKYGVSHHSPFKSKPVSKKLEAVFLKSSGSWGGSLQLYFEAWQQATIQDMLENAHYLNPSIADNGSSMDDKISLMNAIQSVHDELSLNMGSTNIAKNFITSLVNNFNAT